jgi:hypothetical protein
LAFAEASQQSGAWSVPGPYTLAINWNGATGARPVAIAVAPVTVSSGTVVTGPTITNARNQNASGGSLVLVAGSGLTVDGTTSPTHVSGRGGGSSATIANPSGMRSGDLVAVYINTGNTMTAPSGWTLRRQDGQGSVWTQTFTSVPASLGNWSTTGASGWTYTAIAIGGTGSRVVDGTGGGGAQKSSAVKTGSATASGTP